MKRKILKFAAIFFPAVFVIFSAIFYIKYNKVPSLEPRQAVFMVEKGKSAGAIARELETKQIIREKWPFLLAYRLFFRSKTIKAGEYAFELPLSPKAVLEKITEGKITLHPITIPEGLTRRETAGHFFSMLFIDTSDFLAASENTGMISDVDPDAINLEGYLFPETYHFPKNTPVKKIIEAMVLQFRSVFNEEWSSRAEELGMTVRDVVILASLIEKETSMPEERVLISAVFHNRLRIRMKLDCDPTIIYALKEEEDFNGNLRKKDLKFDSPYNTYLYRGLPPGPIANPGKGSLRAALFPADNNFIYFVSKNDGSHYFSSSFREHQNAVNRYQRRH